MAYQVLIKNSWSVCIEFIYGDCNCECCDQGPNTEDLSGQKNPAPQQQLISAPIADSFKGKSLAATVFCDLCSVSCSGIMAFNSHISGAKHQKVFFVWLTGSCISCIMIAIKFI